MELSTPYERLLAAATSMVGTEILEHTDNADTVEAEKFVAANRAALNSARGLLKERCSIPLTYDLLYLSNHYRYWSHLGTLRLALGLEFRLAKSRGEFGRAARIGVDMLDLANTVRRGGLISDMLTSVRFAGFALESLCLLRSHLNEADSLDLSHELDRVECELEPFAEIIERDRRWDTAVDYKSEPGTIPVLETLDPAECGGLSREEQLPVIQELRQKLQAFANSPEHERHARFADSDNCNVAMLRMLRIDLALRSHCAVNSSYPNDLTLLTPKYFAVLPLDPFTEQPFFYRRLTAGSFGLYSTGPGRADHGGILGPWIMVSEGLVDLCLDSRNDELQLCSIAPPPPGVMSQIVSTIRDFWERWTPRKGTAA